MDKQRLSRTRIFRADPALDAALEAGAAREGVKVSVFMRRALASVVRPDDPPPTPPAPAIALPVAARAMERSDAFVLMPPAVPADDPERTPLREQIAVACADAAASFRSLQAVSGQIASLLENGTGTAHDLAGMLQAFEQLHVQADDRITIIGAMCSSAGSA